ncbi:hypothetical protein C0Q96_12275 [Streptomyces albidoflavus]|nr:hypothetical protein C0Q96_12275 [Streptomyces albidoflavus]
MTGLSETPGQRDCSPRVRGWSRRVDARDDARLLLPARAGLVPAPRPSPCRNSALPARAGLVPSRQPPLPAHA